MKQHLTPKDAAYRNSRKNAFSMVIVAHLWLHDPGQLFTYYTDWVSMSNDERRIMANKLLHNAYKIFPEVVKSTRFKTVAKQCCWPLRLGD